MATIRQNLVLQGVSGRIGRLVIRQLRNGTTVLAAAPRCSKRPATDLQKARRNAFAEAVTYAKVAKGALEYQAAAATSGRSAFAVAVSDFLRRRAVREDGLHTA